MQFFVVFEKFARAYLFQIALEIIWLPIQMEPILYIFLRQLEAIANICIKTEPLPCLDWTLRQNIALKPANAVDNIKDTQTAIKWTITILLAFPFFLSFFIEQSLEHSIWLYVISIIT